jgi:hypothetical protein
MPELSLGIASELPEAPEPVVPEAPEEPPCMLPPLLVPYAPPVERDSWPLMPVWQATSDNKIPAAVTSFKFIIRMTFSLKISRCRREEFFKGTNRAKLIRPPTLTELFALEFAPAQHAENYVFAGFFHFSRQD